MRRRYSSILREDFSAFAIHRVIRIFENLRIKNPAMGCRAKAQRRSRCQQAGIHPPGECEPMRFSLRLCAFARHLLLPSPDLGSSRVRSFVFSARKVTQQTCVHNVQLRIGVRADGLSGRGGSGRREPIPCAEMRALKTREPPGAWVRREAAVIFLGFARLRGKRPGLARTGCARRRRRCASRSSGCRTGHHNRRTSRHGRSTGS